jgi:tetratricopeptide (TPR) repeat protein
MGRKRSRKRQHLYLAVACLILVIAAGCAPARVQAPACPECPGCPECPVCPQSYDLKPVAGLISRGNFEGALKESQEILARSPKAPPGDEALMAMGLISAHYANPKKDYKKALSYFMRVEREFPRSPLREEAKIWIGVLQAFEKAKQVDLEIEEMKKGIGK